MVYNDFYIGEDSDVMIVAGCGIDNCGSQDSEHDGIHRFYVGKHAKVKYVEKHYVPEMEKESVTESGNRSVYGRRKFMEMEMVQIKGVDSTVRTTKAELDAGASLVIRERLMTHGDQYAESIYDVKLNGEGANADVISRSVAKDQSYQKFDAKVTGKCSLQRTYRM